MSVKKNTKTTFDIFSIDNDMFTPDVAEQLFSSLQNNVHIGRSALLDISTITSMEPKYVDSFIEFHDNFYQQNVSFVIQCNQANCKTIFSHQDAYLTLNITPTQQEAIDIISMEDVERDLLNEE